MHRVIILAGGKDIKGWTAENPKVMAEVDGVPLVLRVVRQVEAHGLEPIVLTHRENVQAIVPKHYAPPAVVHWERPVGGLRDSIPLWEEGKTTILCSDTFYPPEILDLILSDESPLAVWGDPDEIFAIAFTDDQHGRAIEAIGRAVSFPGHGFLWHFYRALCGNEDLGAHKFDDVIFRNIGRGTATRDFDSVEKYEEWLKNNPRAQQKE